MSAILVTLLYLGVNQKVTAQLEAVPVLLQLLRNELLDTSQKLCIVMCLAVLSDGNSEHNTFHLALLTKQICSLTQVCSIFAYEILLASFDWEV